MSIAVDDAYVYWVTGDTTLTLQRTSKNGTGTTSLASSVAPFFTLDQDFVYYVGDHLYSVAKTGGTPTMIATTNAISGLATDSTRVFMSAQDGILSVVKTGGTPIVIAAATTAQLIGVDDTMVYWISSVGSASILMTSKADGTTSQLAQVGDGTQTLAIDDVNVYATIVAGDLVAISKATGTTTTLTHGLGENGGFFIASAGSSVFVDQQNFGQYPARVLEVPLDGTPARPTCAQGDMSISGLAVDTSSIFMGLVYEANGTLIEFNRP